ncbi:MAG: heparinase II/III family protein [Chloroflexi bacterium OHK40]
MSPFEQAQLAATLRATREPFPFPARAERARWSARAGTPLGHEICARAEAELTEPTPPLPASAFLAFQRSGAREPFEKPHVRRRTRLILFALAECLQGQGRFLDAALNELWAICEESSWVVPAHAAEYPLGLPDPEVPLIDLYSAITAATVAEVDYLLGDALHPAVRARLRAEVERRSTRPFLSRDDYPWLGYGPKPINNWMPVCAGGTAIAALYLEHDLDRLAAVLARALAGIERYLATFGDDGGTPEGIGYWEKGIFFVAAFGELLAARTAGHVDLLAHPRMPRIARFPARVALSPGVYAPFSDTGLDRRPQPALLHFLARRYGLPELAALADEDPTARALTRRGPAEKLRDLFWYPDRQEPLPQARPPAADLLADIQWFVARANPANPNGLVLAAKGGHNAEPHNQNDVGSFVIHWRGESLLADLGAMRYTRDTFRGATRYTLLANRSLGHSVPLVNNHEQVAGPGGARWARWEHAPTSETFALDLAPAYPPAAGLAMLERRITLCRDTPDGAVELCDCARFHADPGRLASVLISLACVRPDAPGQLILEGERGRLLIVFDAAELELCIETLRDVDLRDGPRTVTRVTLAHRVPAHELAIALRFLPLA